MLARPRPPARRLLACLRHGACWRATGGLGLIDEIDLHIAPILPGEGIRLYHNPGGEPIRLHRVGDGDPTSAVNVRYQPMAAANVPAASAG